jgi:hypothetical protein
MPVRTIRKEHDVEVRIRRSSEASARHLTTTSIDKVGKVIPTLTEFGLGGDDQGRELSGQFIVEDEGQAAYFEVCIDDDPA